MILERGNNLDCRDYAASEVPYGTLGTFTWLDPISTISGPLETWKNPNLPSKEKHWDSVPLPGPVARVDSPMSADIPLVLLRNRWKS